MKKSKNTTKTSSQDNLNVGESGDPNFCINVSDGTTWDPNNLVIDPNHYSISIGYPDTYIVYTSKNKHVGFGQFTLAHAGEAGGELNLVRQADLGRMISEKMLEEFKPGSAFKHLHLINRSQNQCVCSFKDAKVLRAQIGGSNTVTEDYLLRFEELYIDKEARDFYNTTLTGVGK